MSWLRGFFWACNQMWNVCNFKKELNCSLCCCCYISFVNCYLTTLKNSKNPIFLFLFRDLPPCLNGLLNVASSKWSCFWLGHFAPFITLLEMCFGFKIQGGEQIVGINFFLFCRIFTCSWPSMETLIRSRDLIVALLKIKLPPESLGNRNFLLAFAMRTLNHLNKR